MAPPLNNTVRKFGSAQGTFGPFRARCPTIVATCALAVVALSGCQGASSEGVRPYQDHAELVSAGVLRLNWAQGSQAYLTVRRMTAIDVLTPPLPNCVVAAAGPKPLYFDLNWTSVTNHTALPAVALTLRTADRRVLTAEFPDGRCKTVDGLSLGPLPSGDREQFVLQLYAPIVRPLRWIDVTIANRHVRLPLVHTCGDRPQPHSQNCTVDPVSYDPGSPYSISVSG